MNKGKVGELGTVSLSLYFSPSFTWICQSNFIYYLDKPKRVLRKRTFLRKSISFHFRLQYNKQRKRINKLDIKIKADDKGKKFEDEEYITIAIDSIGIKVINRGQWMKDNGM